MNTDPSHSGTRIATPVCKAAWPSWCCRVPLFESVVLGAAYNGGHSPMWAWTGSYGGRRSTPGTAMVQKGVQYSPDLEFLAFDVQWAAPDGTAGEHSCYCRPLLEDPGCMRHQSLGPKSKSGTRRTVGSVAVRWLAKRRVWFMAGVRVPRLATAEGLLTAHGFFVAAPLLVGSFEEAMSFDINFPTTIPARLGACHSFSLGAAMSAPNDLVLHTTVLLG
jgi:hypothetical protein